MLIKLSQQMTSRDTWSFGGLHKGKPRSVAFYANDWHSGNHEPLG